MNEEKRMNQGYEIIDSRTVGNREFVIGHHPTAPNPYVCWHCKNGDDYFWGYYTNELSDARDKMRERVENAARDLRESRPKPPKGRDTHER